MQPTMLLIPSSPIIIIDIDDDSNDPLNIPPVPPSPCPPDAPSPGPVASGPESRARGWLWVDEGASRRQTGATPSDISITYLGEIVRVYH